MDRRSKPAPFAGFLLALAAGAFLLPSLPARGGEIAPPVLRPVLSETTEIPGGDFLTLGSFWINDRGSWYAGAGDDFGALVFFRDGELVLRGGDPFPPGPEGNRLESFRFFSTNRSGQAGFQASFELALPRGVYWYHDPERSLENGTVRVLHQGDEAPSFPPGSPMRSFDEVKINNSGELLVKATVDAATIPGLANDVLYLITPNVAGGVESSTVVVAEGDVLPGQSLAVSDLFSGRDRTAFNDRGQVLFLARLSDLSTVIYSYDGALTELAQEGDPSPVAGRNWQSLFPPGISLNQLGEYTFKGQLDGDPDSDEIIVKNGEKLVQEGDFLPDLGSSQLLGPFGPTWITDRGDVLWFGSWGTPGSEVGSGLFWNDRLWIQEGVTTSEDGMTLTELHPFDRGYQVSASGNHVLVRAETYIDTLFKVDLGLFGDGFESGDTSRWTQSIGEPRRAFRD